MVGTNSMVPPLVGLALVLSTTADYVITTQVWRRSPLTNLQCIFFVPLNTNPPPPHTHLTHTPTHTQVTGLTLVHSISDLARLYLATIQSLAVSQFLTKPIYAAAFNLYCLKASIYVAFTMSIRLKIDLLLN